MAIYSLNVATVGKATHAAGTAGAHLRYIAREDAASRVLAAHMPDDAQDARTWMDAYERDARKNARLLTKVRIALPRELTGEQNAALARTFVEELTGGRIPYFLAIHDRGRDAYNPHAHIVLIDRDRETGKRVLKLSDSPRDRKKAGLPENGVSWIRERWEADANRALERAGHDARIDRRSLQAQGIDREAQIHVGPRAQHIDTAVARPASKAVADPTPQHPQRVIDYPLIDAGRTRRERNAEIIDLNLERDSRSPHFETRVLAAFEREQRAKDRPVEAQIMAAARRRTLEERRVRRGAASAARDIRARRDAEAQLTRDWIRQRHAPEVQALREKQVAEREELAGRQDRLFGRFFAALDLTGRTRRRREADRMALSSRHKAERAGLASRIRQNRQAQQEAIAGRYKPELDELAEKRSVRLARLAERHRDEIGAEDALLQQRAAEREQAREVVHSQIDAWKRMQKAEERAQRRREAEAPARSAMRKEWEDGTDGKDRELTPEERFRAAEKRAKRNREEQQRNRHSRDRRRDYD